MVEANEVYRFYGRVPGATSSSLRRMCLSSTLAVKTSDPERPTVYELVDLHHYDRCQQYVGQVMGVQVPNADDWSDWE